jgi:hypothetical protein
MFNALPKFLHFIFICCFVIFIQFISAAQSANENGGDILGFHFTVGANIPGADLADRFGISSQFGLMADYKFDKSEWFSGLNFNYYYGSQVNEDVLSTLRTEQGFIIGINSELASVFLRQRGYYIGVLGGKVFHFKDPNYRSGIRLAVGAGLMRHWVRLLDDTNSVPQIKNEYKKGYDRLTGGLQIQENIAYQIMSNNHRLNFILGFEFSQGFTSSMRDVQFDSGITIFPNRLDLRYALTFTWTLPFYLNQNPEDIFY